MSEEAVLRDQDRLQIRDASQGKSFHYLCYGLSSH